MSADDRRWRREPEASEPEEASAPEAAGTASEAAPQSLSARIEELEEELRRKTEEARASFDRYLREVADGENLKKRTQREKLEAIRYANETLFRELLPILDNLERAIEAASRGSDGASVVQGVELTTRLFRDVLDRFGVKEVEGAEGAPFDPAVHEANSMELSEKVSPNTVLRVNRKGYRLHDRLLRPAGVVVSAPVPGKGNGSAGN